MGQKSVFRTGLTDVVLGNANSSAGSWDGLGTIRVENNATYKYVAFTGATVVAAGDAVGYVVFASDGTLTVVDAATSTMPAGIAMAAIAAGTKPTGAPYYATGWIQIKGVATVSTTVAGSPTIGQALKMGTTPALTIMVAATDSACAVYYGTKTVACDFPY